MSSRRMVSLATVIGMGVVVLVTAAAVASSPTVVLEKAVHFTAPNGDDVLIGPGIYEVEATDQGLRLKPKDGKSEEAKVIQANPAPNPESLEGAKAVAQPLGEDELRVVLLLPEGQGWEAVASFSGIKSRAIIGTNAYYGVEKLPSTNTGINNSAFGYGALQSNTSGISNTAIGAYALKPNTTGSFNTAVGTSALQSNNVGMNNTAVGVTSLLTNTSGSDNTAVGVNAMQSNAVGAANTAMGVSALQGNYQGNWNTAVGKQALASNTTASGNTAVGAFSLNANTTASQNTAVGFQALQSNTTGASNTIIGYYALGAGKNEGFANVALGYYSLGFNTKGNGNTAIGSAALDGNTTGSNNIAIGRSAGRIQTTGSNNVYVNHEGIAGESDTIRIGGPGIGNITGPQTRTFIAGIRGVNLGDDNGPNPDVKITADGQLGIQASSIRYKEDVHDVGSTSDSLLRLRPVTFRYKGGAKPGAGPLHYGLIAEEVAEVFPEVVGRDAGGAVQTIDYDQLIPMLIREVQQQHKRIAEQHQLIQAQQRTNEALEARLAKLEAK